MNSSMISKRLPKSRQFINIAELTYGIVNENEMSDKLKAIA
jgi:hypothetical protein